MATHSRRSPIAEANDDMRYAGTVQRETQRRREELAKDKAGVRPRTSTADTNAHLRGTNASPQATVRSPVAAPTPRVTGNLNANRPNTLAGGAIAASPQQPATPSPIVHPPTLTGPTGTRATDAAQVKATVGFTQPAQASPQVAVTNPTAPQMGKTLSTAQSDAALGPVTGANGYGTGSVRYAKAGETQSPLIAGSMDPNGTGPQHAGAFDHEAARADLFKRHPNIFTAGTPENQAFAAHAQKYGLQAAHQNADALMATLNPSQGGPTAANVKNDIGGAPTPDALAAHDATMAASQPSLPVQAGRAAANAGGAIANIGNAVANAPRTAANALDKAISGFATGVTGQPQDMHPIASAGRAVKNAAGPLANAAMSAGNAVARESAKIPSALSSATAAPQGPAPTFQQGDAKWSGNSPQLGPPAPITEGAKSQIASPVAAPAQGEKFVREPQITFQPQVPPTQAPPVANDVDQQKLKKKVANPTL